MSSHAEAVESHVPATAKLFVTVWVGLVAITGIEVLLAYNQIAPGIMLTVLVGLSIIKAGMIMAFFMHLKYERFGLVLLLVPAFMFCVMMICIFFFPDSLRLGNPAMH
ncbi:MAG TPA: cytochrome C oxidase subunit IV family protein [Candidatus Acidoferrales bacterium]